MSRVENEQIATDSMLIGDLCMTTLLITIKNYFDICTRSIPILLAVSENITYNVLTDLNQEEETESRNSNYFPRFALVTNENLAAAEAFQSTIS